jgi:hypothetical protein
MSQKSLPLTIEGFLERLKQEDFTPVQVHASLANRNYLLGDHVLWCSPQGHAYLIELSEYESATKNRTKVNWVAADMLFYEDGVERMLAEIRKRVTKVAPVPELTKSEPPARQLSDCEKAWGYKKPVLRDGGDT